MAYGKSSPRTIFLIPNEDLNSHYSENMFIRTLEIMYEEDEKNESAVLINIFFRT